MTGQNRQFNSEDLVRYQALYTPGISLNRSSVRDEGILINESRVMLKTASVTTLVVFSYLGMRSTVRGMLLKLIVLHFPVVV